MEAATLAVVRASRSSFETAHDKLAFAVHAFVLANGFKLVATGAAAEDESADFSASREEVEPTGWDSQEGTYAFRYQDTEGSRAPLYVKCLAVGSQLLVHWVGASGGKVPLTLELDTAAYTTDAPAAPACYQRTKELVSKIGGLLASALDRGASAATTTDRSAVAGQPGSTRAAEREAEPHQEQPGVSGMGYRPPGVPFGIGVNDVVPPGMIPPGYGGGPALPGLMDPRGMRGGGGGMHVGPGDPIFGPGRMGGGVGAPPGHGSLPPGARWDPIAPPGMQGFHPDDFQRPAGGRPHPDMAQPGPGRGADMDYMFG